MSAVDTTRERLEDERFPTAPVAVGDEDEDEDEEHIVRGRD
ncbi:hypothetical protein ACFFQW_49210 [Umezawaea endophytica]|uniref:Uncharacterized protein n=1 Tax=Umezawaea endophytica TaxID=1654476 RepID=A0A9X2VZJ7_9PSEU|nr:hypothetical protein [Umezawaea endophytica]MCS7484854.1 hypothetical protein [Umezawaea endophytica]